MLGTDQRGVARPQGPLCDIGAVEMPPAPTITTVDPPSGLVGGGTPITIGGSDFRAGMTRCWGSAGRA